MNPMKHAILMFFAAGSALAGQVAWADDAPATSDTSEMTAAFDVALPDAELSNYRGGATITNLNDLDATLYNNTALDSVTGGNVVTEGALAGMSGLSTLIQNSGNNVLIQSAIILNLQVQ
jgi:hypothetical protein